MLVTRGLSIPGRGQGGSRLYKTQMPIKEMGIFGRLSSCRMLPNLLEEWRSGGRVYTKHKCPSRKWGSFGRLSSCRILPNLLVIGQNTTFLCLLYRRDPQAETGLGGSRLYKTQCPSR